MDLIIVLAAIVGWLYYVAFKPEPQPTEKQLRDYRRLLYRSRRAYVRQYRNTRLYRSR